MEDASAEYTEYGYDTTYCEWLAKTRWGAYINEIEARAVLKGHNLSSEVSQALEIGCEGGRWSRLLAGFGWNMVCTDVNASFLAVCQRRLPNARCVHVDARDSRFPCEDGSVGLLLCVGVPAAIQSPGFVTECARVLKDGGLAVGTFWNLISIRGSLLHLKAACCGGNDYYRFPYSRWRKKMAKSGLEMVHEEGYCWFPFRRASNSAAIPFAVRMERTLGLKRMVSVSPWVAFVAQKGVRPHGESHIRSH